jgi:hypothetical protein
MTDARVTSYATCSCGQLVRCGRLDPASEQAKGLAALNSLAFAGECPGCKTVAQLTFTSPNLVVKPTLTVIKKD